MTSQKPIFTSIENLFEEIGRRVGPNPEEKYDSSLWKQPFDSRRFGPTEIGQTERVIPQTETTEKPVIEQEPLRTPTEPQKMACIKMVFFGACGSGGEKSEFLDTEPTVGGAASFQECFTSQLLKRKTANYIPKQYNIFGNTTKIDIWDITGKPHFEALYHLFYEGAHVIVVCYDVMDEGSFLQAKKMVGELLAKKDERTSMAIVGNKRDLGEFEEPAVNVSDAIAFAKASRMIFMEVSAKLNVNVDILFQELADVGLKGVLACGSPEAEGQPAEWVPDSSCKSCSDCWARFTLTNRRHHCRHCGFIFCNNCSSQRRAIAHFKRPVRVCNTCVTKLDKKAAFS